MVALVLVDHLLQQHAQCHLFGDVGFAGGHLGSDVLPPLSETVDSAITAGGKAKEAYSED